MLAPHTAPLIPISYPVGPAWHCAFVSMTEMHRSKGLDGRFYFPVEKRINELSFETYVPVEVKKDRFRGKPRIREIPVLGPYVFVRFDPDRDCEEWPHVLNTEGVHSLLGQMGVPQRIPQELISELRRAEEAGLFGGPGLAEGDTVQVKSGPFEHLIGRIKSATKRKRIKILLEGLAMPVEIDSCMIEKIR